MLQGMGMSQRPQGHAPQQSMFPGHHPQQPDALHGALGQGQGLRYQPEPLPHMHQSRLPGYHGQEREQAVGQHTWSQTPQVGGLHALCTCLGQLQHQPGASGKRPASRQLCASTMNDYAGGRS